MNAQEMFEKLGYNRPEKPVFSERYGHVISFIKIDESETEKVVDRVIFHIIKRKYSRSGFIKNYEDLLDIKECPFNHYLDNSIELHQAIHQQMKELGWV